MQQSRSSTNEKDAKRAFAEVMTPPLVLVAPAGMQEGERQSWLRAAFEALGDLPIEYLKMGARVAMQEADHPSKIVAIVNREARKRWNDRRDSDRRAQDLAKQLAEQRALLTGPEQPVTRETTQEILDRVWPTRHEHEAQDRWGDKTKGGLDPDRPCRAPTAEDYARLGYPDAAAFVEGKGDA